MFVLIMMLFITLTASSPAASGIVQGDLTGSWQLFVDDGVIAEKANVTRTYHAFEKHPGNPVLLPDKPWEGCTAYVYGTVLPGEDGTGYRMWYHAWDGKEYRNLYATSPDGLHWTKPELGLVTYGDNKQNNILFRRTAEDHNQQVIYTPWEKDPNRRYKLMNWDYGRTPPKNIVSGYYGAWSPDGIHWIDAPKNPVLRDPVGDVGNFVWDAHAKRYMGYPKQFTEVRGFRRRCVGFAETRNFESWPAPAFVLAPDEFDDRWVEKPGQHTDFYGLCGFAYESMYLGFLWIFRITAAGDNGTIFVELVSSRDGVHWTRQEEPRPPVLPLGPSGAWDSGMVFTPNHPLVEGNVIKLFYGGSDATHAVVSAKSAIGMATLRKDGFASLDAGAEEGSVTTIPLHNTHGALVVNYIAQNGLLQAEVLDDKGAVIAGYGREDCLPLSGDSVNQPVLWKTQKILPAATENIQVRFVLRNASFYSFKMETPDPGNAGAISMDGMKKARKAAAARQRRIMYNDDGCDVRPFKTPEEFLALRLRQVANTQVDTICYCTGGGGLYWAHVPKVGEALGEFVADTDEQYVKDLCAGLHALEKLGTDPLAVAVQFGHENSIEVFWSSRMNNIEDSFVPWGHPRWKREHPEYLLGKPEDYEKYEMTDPRKWWAALDFAVPEVRDYMLRIFEDVFTRYDLDGIDMDWFRHPKFFRETNEDRPVTPEHLAMMNDFMRKVRALTERVAMARNRPFLVSCRIPLSVERCVAIGLDVPAWLEEDLVDILVLGGDLGPMAMAPQLREMTELTHQHGVRAMANICGSGLQPAHGYSEPGAWYGAAMNAWQAGVDGIYIFNLFPSEPDERLNRIGARDTLRGLDKVYAIDPIEPRDFWGFDRAALVVPDRLPIQLVPGASVTAKLPVGEDIAVNAPEGKTPKVCLRIRVTAAAESDQLQCTMNDTDLGPATPVEALGSTPAAAWFQLVPPIQAFRPGDNLIGARFNTQRTGRDPVLMDRLELTINY
ncbi:MAG TPA: family 10 glycosylhydrolase [Candidatus Hydrogenedentes bacterium]|nr:family 10 glycosylhydrolase [Candidatus Hydrogenedentota bacterium]